MRKLLIIGAGGHGRCCLDIARDMDIFDKISFLDDNQINKMAEFFGRMPFALSVGITAYCAVMSVYITVRLHHCRNTDITAMSIKESFDGLPTGLCYLTKTDLLY